VGISADSIISEDWVSAARNNDSMISVPDDIVVFIDAGSSIGYANAAIAPVDQILSDSWLCATYDRNSNVSKASDFALFQMELSSRNPNSATLPTQNLSYRQVADATAIRLEQ
jgi:hypothetical protein